MVLFPGTDINYGSFNAFNLKLHRFILLEVPQNKCKRRIHDAGVDDHRICSVIGDDHDPQLLVVLGIN